MEEELKSIRQDIAAQGNGKSPEELRFK